MPRYFLDIRYERSTVEDDDGIEFPDLPAARAEAERSLREIVANGIKEARPLVPRSIEIRTAHGNVVDAVLVRDILPPNFLN